ncbi:MAG: NAD-dependent epimerase/dehydratase family protein [Ignavibacteria bacterium]|jgi:dihydroflavonol-4-reductase
MKVLVTGATGLLGSNIVPLLLGQNYEVTALVRSIPRGRQLFGYSIAYLEGDLGNVSKFENELRDFDTVIHCAAHYSQYYKDGNENTPFRINLNGTKSLLNAAYSKGIRNFIYISSSGVLKTTNVVKPTNENDPYDEDIEDSYFQSKIVAEKEALKFARSHKDMRIIIILPSLMIGPNDFGPTPTGNFILSFLKKQIRFVLPGTMKIVDARDVAGVVVKSITKGKSGERYLVGGKQYPISKILEILSEISGIPVPSKKLTPRKVLFMAHIMKFISKIKGKQPPASLKLCVVKRLLKNFWYDSTKAVNTFGIKFRPINDTLTDTVKWFQNAYMR